MPALPKTKKEEAFKVDPSKLYEFELCFESQYATIPRSLKVWDPESEKIRSIRYAKTEKSPFLDEQNKEVPNESDIAFNRGKLRVPGTDAALIRFLMLHDGIEGKEIINPDNYRYKNYFRYIDPDKNLTSGLDKKRAIAKAVGIVDAADPEKLKNFITSEFGFDPARVQGISEEKYQDALLKYAFECAELKPEIFVKDFENTKHEYKSAVIYAFRKGLLHDNVDGEVHWAATDGLIHSYDTGKFVRATDAMAAWIQQTEEGKKFHSELTSKLEE